MECVINMNIILKNVNNYTTQFQYTIIDMIDIKSMDIYKSKLQAIRLYMNKVELQ